MKRGIKLEAFAAPVVMCGNHEPLIFRRRTGHATDHEEETFAYEHSPELVEALAARGCTWVRTHFFKGFGLEAEREEIEMTRRFVQLAHKHGIKVELYTQWGTLQYETLLGEEPGMLDWCVVTSESKYAGISYGHQDFRHRPCLTRPGYWEYLKKVVRLGIETIHGDAIGFDNVGNTTLGEQCLCPQCCAAFVQYLKDKYQPQTPQGATLARERFGFSLLDHIRPPTFNRWNHPVNYKTIVNPVFQEYVAFRCDALRRRFDEMYRFIKDLNPHVVVEYNIYYGLGMNAAWWNGSDMHQLLPHMDAFWDERMPRVPSFDGQTLLHRVHGMKLSQAGGTVTFGWNQGNTPAEEELSIAENLAFNQGHIAGFGRSALFARGNYPEADAMIAFRTAHADLYADTTPAAQVALLESARMLALDCAGGHYAEVLAMGSLLAGHVPFDLVLNAEPFTLAPYAVLVLPDIRIMTDAKAQRLMDYVAAGGGLVLTDQTGHFDHWYRRRKESALATMLQYASAAKQGMCRGSFGQGRYVFLQELAPAVPFAQDDLDGDMFIKYWRLPKNRKQFLDAILWAANCRLDVEVSAPLGLAAEVRRTADARTIVHLVNYNLKKPAAAVSLNSRTAGTMSARLWTPWDAKPKELKIATLGSGQKISVGTVRRYAVVELR